MRLIILLLACVLFTSLLHADQPVLKDFAFCIELSVETPGTLYTLQLPEAVYQNISRKDFGDIRIFNENNDLVPFSMKQPIQQEKQAAKPAILPFFPVYEATVSHHKRFSLSVNTDSTGAIINIQNDEKSNSDKTLQYYLIDLTGLQKSPDQLHGKNPDKLMFLWSMTSKNFSVKTSVEYSQDLTDWSTIATDTTLASLNFSGHTLVKNTINLLPVTMKYLRISWPFRHEPLKITEVHALFPDQERHPPLKWRMIQPIKRDHHDNTLDYHINGIYPLSFVSLELPDQNSLLKAIIKSRPDRKADWRIRHTGLFYQVAFNGTSFLNPDIPVFLTTDPFWKIDFLSEVSVREENSPHLKFGWVPHQIYFLNQGSGPFRLAFCNPDIKPMENLVEPFLESLKKDQRQEMIKTVKIGKLSTLGKKKNRSFQFPWRTWLLWGILICGVVLLGGMAIRLLKQMNTTDD